MKHKRIVVVGAMASSPWAGLAWMHMQITAGLRRLGHDAYYFETTSAWPYDPVRKTRVCDSNYSVPYLSRVADDFSLGDRWAYRRSFSDKEWLGLSRQKAEDLLAHADAVLNVAGATRFANEGLRVGRLIYFGADPGVHEIKFNNGDEGTQSMIAEHAQCVTYGENIGTSCCPLPPLPRLVAKTRQPVLMDAWRSGAPSKSNFTTVGNWKQVGYDLEFRGETYYWSKDREFLKFIDLPQRCGKHFELALGLSDKAAFQVGHDEKVAAPGINGDMRDYLKSKGWALVDAHQFTTDHWKYKDYIVSSRGEFTVVKDQYGRLKTGWFSERSACYLAAGRPVIMQDTGFGNILPTGEGLFAFQTMEDILAAVEAIKSDYEKHSRAAREIAQEYFCAEKVMKKLLTDLGI